MTTNQDGKTAPSAPSTPGVPSTPSTPSVPKFEYKYKANVTLEDSDKEEYGVVRDTTGIFDFTHGQGDVVGTWTRSRVDNLIRVSLLPSIEALYDKAVRTWQNYAEERKIAKEIKASGGRVAGKRKTKLTVNVEAPEPVKLPDEEKIKFNDMRARLMKSRAQAHKGE